MTFLNPALALGAAALAVPLVIHLLNRSRFRTVDWGATHLLVDVLRTNRRRFRLDQLLLLLVRCAIPVLLAFCLARPVWTGAEGAAGDGPVSLAILLDDSRSMSVADGARFDAARAAVRDLIAAAGRGSDFTVIRSGGPPAGLTDAPTFDAPALLRELDAAEPAFGPTDAPAALEAALSALAGMSHADRELVVLSDFQPADWALDEPAAAALRRRIDELPVPPRVTLLPVAGVIEEVERGNLSVDAVEAPARPVGVGGPVRIRATMRNHDPNAERPVRVALTVNGEETDAGQQVVVPPGGTVRVLFVQSFATAGTHAVAVAATPAGGADALPADDVGRATVRVLDRLPVLLVDGAPGREPLSGETDYLAVALSPLSFGGTGVGGAADLLETSAVRPGELSADTLAEPRLVVLANVARLGDEQLDALTEYVRGGGSLLIAAGDRLDLAWHRERLYAGGGGLLPRAWAATAGDDGPPAHVLRERFDDPALEPFNDPAHGDLSAADVRRWMTVEEPADDTDGGRVLARLNTGDPLLIARPFGEGRVVQMTTAVDADWSDLPLRPAFVPLAQGLAAGLATRPGPPTDLRPGDAAVAEVPAGVATVAAETPAGARLAVNTTVEGNRTLARFEATRRPGFYTLSWPAVGDDPGAARFAVAADPRESLPGTLGAEELNRLAERLGATVADSAADHLARDDRRRHGRELWRWLLAGLLAALFLELVLQQRFGTPAGGATP